MADSQRKTANLLYASTSQTIGSVLSVEETIGSTIFILNKSATQNDVSTTVNIDITLEAGSYTLSVIGLNLFNTTFDRIFMRADDGTIIAQNCQTNRPITFTLTEVTHINRLSFVAAPFSIYSNSEVKVMLNEGSTPLPYEPYGWVHSLRKLTTTTDTITTLPADIYADGTNATVGLKGNIVQNGTPTPQNPIQPSECGERTGNLFDKNDVLQDYRIGGDGAPFRDMYCALGGYIEVTPNTIVNQHQAFTLSNCMAEYDENKTFIIRRTSGNGKITTSASTKYIRVSVEKIKLDEAMVTMGATAPTSYEPYGYKLTISSANTTTPVYLGEVETTRRIKKLVLTGGESWTKNDVSKPSNYLYYQTGYLANKTCVCSHLEDMGTLSASKVGIFNANNVLYLNFGSAIMNAQPSGNTVAGLKEYLAAQYAAGTPVTVWYVLATEETGIVNEPLRKIGDYADTVSGITIPTITGKDTVDVETTLKPSEVSLSYTGWHDASVKEWDGSQWS